MGSSRERTGSALKRKTDNNFLLKILSRFSATRLRSVLQLVSRSQFSFLKDLLREYIDFEDDLEDLGDPIGEEDDKEAREGASDHFFTFFLSFFVSGAS